MTYCASDYRDWEEQKNNINEQHTEKSTLMMKTLFSTTTLTSVSPTSEVKNTTLNGVMVAIIVVAIGKFDIAN